MRDVQQVRTALDHIYGVSEMTDIRERVVVSPAKGRFHPHPPEVFTTEGEWVEPGQVLGLINNGAEAVPVVCSFTGWMMGMLAIAGQPVATGDQLFWVRS